MVDSLSLLGCWLPPSPCRISNTFSFTQQLALASSSHINLRRSFAIAGKPHSKEAFKTFSCLTSEDANSISQEPARSRRGETFEQWNSMTAKFSGAANLPILLMQLPQIVLNARNLLAGNKSALLAVPWLMEIETMAVQTVGVISRYIVLLQLAMAEAMPLLQFIVVSVMVTFGLILNFLKYFGLLDEEIWLIWEDAVTVIGFSTLPQVMWSTFVPYVPNTVLPSIISFATALLAVVMHRMGKLSEKFVKFLGMVSGWTATLLLMWMSVAQMWTNLMNPENIKGLSAVSMLLALIGNGLFIPRSLFIRDLMWFAGSNWVSFFYGWGNLVCLYCFNCISKEFFWASTVAFLAWIGMAFWKDMEAHGLSSPIASLKELIIGP
ncbi:maltose excess protein 1-like, chloroplastic isoform X2 [Andrographis paniculata]|uniref:maltose excess protein 1-like, chloroplastic isoform X2 n=1 Tax=Andrographis paniculata TaxID=175694 RepID=UPI0021E898D0|nr:maltose excess protein 1-like, chloroplastic isoform X2 [Andrographis paniculata]